MTKKSFLKGDDDLCHAIRRQKQRRLDIWSIMI